MCSVLATKLNIPNVLLLILVGLFINKLTFQGQKLIEFPPIFLTSVAILALVMIVFDGTSRFNIRDINQFSVRVLKLVLVFIFLNSILLTVATLFIYRLHSVSRLFEFGLALIFAFINCGTDPGTVLVMLTDGRERISKVLKIESVINTPFMVLLPFIIIELMESFKVESIANILLSQFMPFLQQFVTGIGAGVLIAIVFFKFMRKRYSERLSPLAILTATLLTYTLAENLGGNGVLAVTTLGLFFGNVVVAQKEQLLGFSTVFALVLEILVFVFIGLIVEIPLTWGFFIRSLTLFAFYLIIRYLSIHATFRSDFNFKEKLFMTFNVSKGIAVATIAFTITMLFSEPTSVLYQLQGIPDLLNLTLVFMLYSIILSTFVVRYTDLFLKKPEEEVKPKAKKSSK